MIAKIYIRRLVRLLCVPSVTVSAQVGLASNSSQCESRFLMPMALVTDELTGVSLCCLLLCGPFHSPFL